MSSSVTVARLPGPVFLPLFLEGVQVLVQVQLTVAQFRGHLVLLGLDGLVLFLPNLLQDFHGVLDRGGGNAAPQANTGTGLVQQVDGLVGQETVGDEASGQGGGGADGGVGEFHVVVVFVVALDTHENVDGLVAVGLFNPDGLQAAFQCRVAFHVLAVVVQSGGANALDLATGQRRLEDVGGVHCALGGPGADQGMDFVNEQDAVAGGLDLFDYLLEAFLELAAVLGAGYQGAHVESYQALALEGVGDYAGVDLLGQSLDDGGLAYAGFAHQDRVVLGAAAEDLDHPLDFRISAHHRVQLAVAGCVGEVDAQLVEGGGAGAGAGTLGASAAGGTIAEDAVGFGAYLLEGYAEAFQYAGGDAFAFAEKADEQMLGADVGVVHTAGLIDRQFHNLLGPGCEADFALGGLFATANNKFYGGTGPC